MNADEVHTGGAEVGRCAVRDRGCVRATAQCPGGGAAPREDSVETSTCALYWCDRDFEASKGAPPPS